MRFIDTHLHLTDKRFDGDRDEVIQRSVEADVTTLVTQAVTLDNAREALRIANVRNESTDDGKATQGVRLWATAGFHPHQSVEFDPTMEDDLRELWADPTVVAVGEIGIDYHYDFSPCDVQKKVFARHIELALEVDLPIVIHCRESFDDIFAIVEEHYRGRTPKDAPDGSQLPHGVFHCFSEGPAEAEKVLDLGFIAGFGGALTFKRNDAIREAAKIVGADRCVLETDAPYMAPVPKRGRRNEPSYVPHVARLLADTLGVPLAEVAGKTTAAAERLYRLPQR